MEQKVQANPVGLEAPKPLQTAEEFLNQFVFLVYYVNPVKDSVRLVLDDGSIKLFLKRDKFQGLIEKIINETLEKERQYTLFRIKESLRVYGGLFYYDRKNNEFRQLSDTYDIEKITPQELLSESRKSLVKETLLDNFKDVNREANEHLYSKFNFTPIKKKWNSFTNSVITSFTSKKKKNSL